MESIQYTEIINVDPETMGGTPVFKNTRVPIQALFDYIEGGDSIKEFLDDFPSVSREQVLGLMKLISKLLFKIDLNILKNENTFGREYSEKMQATFV